MRAYLRGIPHQQHETRKPGCPRRYICSQWQCWASYLEKTQSAPSSVKFDWDTDFLTEVYPVNWNIESSWSWRGPVGKFPTEWEDSVVVSLRKGKDVAQERGNYRSLKWLDQLMGVLGSVTEHFLRQQVRIDDMHSLASCLDAVERVSYSLYAIYNKNSTP